MGSLVNVINEIEIWEECGGFGIVTLVSFSFCYAKLLQE